MLYPHNQFVPSPGARTFISEFRSLVLTQLQVAEHSGDVLMSLRDGVLGFGPDGNGWYGGIGYQVSAGKWVTSKSQVENRQTPVWNDVTFKKVDDIFNWSDDVGISIIESDGRSSIYDYGSIGPANKSLQAVNDVVIHPPYSLSARIACRVQHSFKIGTGRDAVSVCQLKLDNHLLLGKWLLGAHISTFKPQWDRCSRVPDRDLVGYVVSLPEGMDNEYPGNTVFAMDAKTIYKAACPQ